MRVREPETLRSATFLVVVRGLQSEAAAVEAALDRADPAAVGLIASPEELAGLAEYFVGQPGEPLVPLSGVEEAELRGLARFEEVATPTPAVLAALEWASTHGRPTVPLDWSDDEYDERFAARVGYVELVRRTRRERRLQRQPPRAEAPEQFIASWERVLRGSAGSERLAQEREVAAAERIRRAAAESGRLAVVVESERADGILRALGDRPPPVPAAGQSL